MASIHTIKKIGVSSGESLLFASMPDEQNSLEPYGRVHLTQSLFESVANSLSESKNNSEYIWLL